MSSSKAVGGPPGKSGGQPARATLKAGDPESTDKGDYMMPDFREKLRCELLG